MSSDNNSKRRKLHPFDQSLNFDASMYDNLPYKRDITLCNADTVALWSGNIFKFFRCTEAEPILLDDVDARAREKITEFMQKEELRKAEEAAKLQAKAEPEAAEGEEIEAAVPDEEDAGADLAEGSDEDDIIDASMYTDDEPSEN
ncbi:MAG: hypothetical protein K6G65_06200 [Lachnospiraceae bacterium]|nr:hypothetical protein [Lachnospiraceae bacterium]